jgi:hypothetical protein
MKCLFYGSFGVSRSPSGKYATVTKAKCPECGAVRTLQRRSGNMWFYPEHETLMTGIGRDTVYLVYVNTSGVFVEP